LTERITDGIISSKRHRRQTARAAGFVGLVALGAALALSTGCARRGNPADGGDSTGYHIVGTLATGGYAEDVKVVGNIAVVAAGQEGVVVVDVTDPAAPALLGIGPTLYEATGCDYAPTDSLAYVTDGSVGVVAYDMSDPGSPVYVTYCQGTRTRDLEIVETTPGLLHHIFAADGEGGFRVWELRYYPGYDAWFGNGLYQSDTQGSARGICVYEGTAFVAVEQLGLALFDVTNPASPAPLGSVDTPGEARGVAASEGYAYVADWRAGVQVVDVSDPMQPEIVATIPTPGNAVGVFCKGNKLYVADHTGGLLVFDVTDPSAPTAAGSLDTPFANAVFVTDSHVFVADRDWGLVVAEEE
jgi:hypothetical protein